MTRMTMTLVLALGALSAQSALAQRIVTGGAGNTGITAPSNTGGVDAGTIETGASDTSASARGGAARTVTPSGDAASPGNASVPGTTPAVPIGGTATSGPPGTGGAAGGPSLGR